MRVGALLLGLVIAGALSLSAAADAPLAADWPQWGGPNRNFKIDAAAISTAWPASGPPKLWERPLGEGYSTIVTAGDALYTLYRRGQQDIVIAVDANTGKTRWEAAFDAPTPPGANLTAGPGPYASPLIVNQRLFITTVHGQLHALDRQTGKRLWMHDLWKEFQGTTIDPGYAASPIALNDTIIVPVGGRGHAIMSFRQQDGSVVWKKGDFAGSPSSPFLATIGGRLQLVDFMAHEVAGFDAATGEPLWSAPHETSWNLNVAMPAWCEEEGILVIASAYNGGARGLKITASGAQELWKHNRLRVHHTNMICTGGVVYGSSGDFGPAPMTALDAVSGRVLWQARELSKATMVQVGGAGGRYILLDEDGTLAIAELSRTGMKMLAQTQILEQTAWTAPTLVGTRLYVRDRKHMLALELK
jgi:outer membrane protein assembly factor BamB